MVALQYWVRKVCPCRHWQNEWSMIVFNGFVPSKHANPIMYGWSWIINNDFFWSLVKWCTNDFDLWLGYIWKSLVNCLTCDKKSLSTVSHALYLIFTKYEAAFGNRPIVYVRNECLLLTLCPREAYDFNQKAVLVQRDLNPLFTFFSYFAIARSFTILSEQNDTYIIVCVSLIA